MIAALGRRLDRLAGRYMPDPFVLAIGLTFVVAVLGVLLGEKFSADADWIERISVTVSSWKSFLFEPPHPTQGVNRKLLYFAFQMCLMLVTGHALASSPPVARFVRRLAQIPQSFEAAVTLVAFTACFMALIHWGLGLIVGAMIARESGRELARRKIAHHYPLLGAAGYTGLMVWGGGLSASIPLAAAGQAQIPLQDTLFSTLNLVISGALLIFVPWICRFLVPRETETMLPFVESDTQESMSAPHPQAHRWGLRFGALFGLGSIAAYFMSLGINTPLHVIYALLNAGLVGLVGYHLVALFSPSDNSEQSPAERLNNSAILVALLSVMALGWLESEVLSGQFKLSFNNLNFAFLFLGLLFQGRPIRYVQAVSDGAKGCAGIILQFPLYFGILGIMVGTGLAAVFTDALVGIASESSYPIFTYFSAGLVNLFVPSGGGQWIVQGSIVIDGATALGSPSIVSKSIMALAYGDAWTNMLQPFWAVLLLAITGLRARDIIGYTATVMILSGALTITCLTLL